MRSFLVSKLLLTVTIFVTVAFTSNISASLVAGQANCSYPTAFYTQLADHVPGCNRTFQQQYQLITKYYQPGGPILFYQGAEGKVMQCLDTTTLLSWAQELGAVVATLEHRSFGASLPSNVSDLAVKYESLTLDNVMMDAIRFVEFVKNTVTGAGTARVITAGASYGGFLSALQRLNYPDNFFAAVAWGAPMRGFGLDDDDTNPDRFNWMDHTSNVYLDQSVSAAMKIQVALQVFANDTANNSTLPEQLVSRLNLCTLPSNRTDYVKVLQYLTQAYAFVTQYSTHANGDPLPMLINATLLANDTAYVLKAVLTVEGKLSNPYGTCVNWAANNGIAVGNAIDLEAFIAATCKYFPNSEWFQISNNSIFPAAASVSLSNTATQCGEFNISAAHILTQQQVQKKYNFTQADIEHSTRILFPMGELDPVAGIGPKPFNWAGQPGYTDRSASRAWTVTNMAHCEDSAMPRKGDKPSVVHARAVELNMLKEWLGQY